MLDTEKQYEGAYLIDTNVFRPLYNFIYDDVFPEIWDGISILIEQNKFVSVAEVKKEYDYQLSHRSAAVAFSKENSHLFLKPGPEDAYMLREIYKIPEFQLKPKEIKNKKSHADAFLVAKAKVLNGCVVTDESPRSKEPAKIPNICMHFGVNCMTMHEFMRILKETAEANK